MADVFAQIDIPKRALFKATEVCDLVKVQLYVLRSWEAEFPALGVAKTAGTPRMYRRADVEQVARIKHLLEIEQKWRSMPAAGCLRLAVQRDKRCMLIADTRITAAKARNLEWGGASEISICLIESSLALSKRPCTAMTTTYFCSVAMRFAAPLISVRTIVGTNHISRISSPPGLASLMVA